MKKILFRMFCIIAVVAASCTEDNPVSPAKPENPMPKILFFSPDASYIGDTVTVTGKNFAKEIEANRLFFSGGALADNISMEMTGDTAAIACIVPQGAKSGKISIATKDGIDTCNKQFRIIEPPPGAVKILSYPKSARCGSVITITGTNFGTEKELNKVRFGSMPATVVDIDTSNPMKLTVIVPNTSKTAKKGKDNPLAVTCRIKVQVWKYSDSTEADFTMLESNHQIRDFYPKTGLFGTKVSIYGSGFGNNKDEVQVKFGDMAAEFISIEDTMITVYAPDINQNEFIKVIKKDEEVLSGTIFKLIKDAPVIYDFTPEMDISGTEVKIRCKNISERKNELKLFFGIYTNSANEIEINDLFREGEFICLKTVISGVDGYNKLYLTYKNYNVESQKYYTIRAPKITLVQPLRGCIDNTIILRGTMLINSKGSVDVYFGDKKANIDSISQTYIKTKVPKGAVTSNVSIKYFQDKEFSYLKTFEVIQLAIDSVNKSIARPGDTVILKGAAFDIDKSRNILDFNGTPSTIIFSDTATIKALVPQNATDGYINIKVADNIAHSKDTFYIKYMKIDSIRPLKVKAGNNLTVFGSGFVKQGGGSLEAYFDSTKLDVVNIEDNKVTLKIPETGTKKGKYLVKLQKGIAAETGKDSIMVTQLYDTGTLTIGGVKVVYYYYYHHKLGYPPDSSVVTSRNDTTDFNMQIEIKDADIFVNWSEPCGTCSKAANNNTLNYCKDYWKNSYYNFRMTSNCYLETIGIDIDTTINYIKNFNYDYKYWESISYLSQSGEKNKYRTLKFDNIPFTKQSDGKIIVLLSGKEIEKLNITFSDSETSWYNFGSGDSYNNINSFVKFLVFTPDSYMRLELNP